MGLLVALLLVEVGMRYAYDYLPFPVQSMIRHVRVWGNAGQRLGPSWLETCVGDPHLGARNLPDLKDHRVQFGPAIYHVSTTSLGFDGLGFRTPEYHGSWDGVVVGDSFAFCHHIEIEDCWVTRLAGKTGLKLANLAVPATGSASHSRYLEKYGRKLDPGLVIWQYWVNDPREDVEHVAGGFLPCPRSTNDIELSEPSTDLRRWLKEHSIAANLVYQTWERQQAGSSRGRPSESDAYFFETTSNRRLFAWRGEGAASRSRVATVGFEMTTAAIGLAARRSRARGSQFLLLIAPSNLQVYADKLPNEVLRAEMEAENRTTDQLIVFARENEIEYLDLRPAFIAAAARGEDLYPYYDVHWTPAGNELAADIVTAWIRQRGIERLSIEEN
tara:strand:+ start:1039 stop:2199 length:1161 start_codon:yes stop_codon:yes gene_type:complete